MENLVPPTSWAKKTESPVSRGLCFVSPTPDYLHCPICLAVLVGPVNLNNCAHVCCRSCFDAWCANKMECPVCREPATRSFHSPIVQDVLNELTVRCPFGVVPSASNAAGASGVLGKE
jgi:hypothetical protein